MAAFLSSLYVLADFIARKGSGAEQRVLEMLFCLCRFPPAVRARKMFFVLLGNAS